MKAIGHMRYIFPESRGPVGKKGIFFYYNIFFKKCQTVHLFQENPTGPHAKDLF
jgi:hypothetical protein